MNKINTFGEFLNEVTNTPVSGTRAGWTASLDRKKYELKKDIKGAKIGSYYNVLLPKGTVITNLPGGVFANHDDLKKKYCTGYGAERWDSSFGVMITQLPEVLVDIEKNSKVLESEEFVNEASKSRLDTKNYIEPEEMQATLSQIYHILSGNVGDYVSIKGIEDTIKDLKKYA